MTSALVRRRCGCSNAGRKVGRLENIARDESTRRVPASNATQRVVLRLCCCCVVRRTCRHASTNHTDWQTRSRRPSRAHFRNFQQQQQLRRLIGSCAPATVNVSTTGATAYQCPSTSARNVNGMCMHHKLLAYLHKRPIPRRNTCVANCGQTAAVSDTVTIDSL